MSHVDVILVHSGPVLGLKGVRQVLGQDGALADPSGTHNRYRHFVRVLPRVHDPLGQRASQQRQNVDAIVLDPAVIPVPVPVRSH